MFMDHIPDEKVQKKQEDLQEKMRKLFLRQDPHAVATAKSSGSSKGASRAAAAARLAGKDGRPAVPHRLVNPLSTLGGGHKLEHAGGGEAKKHTALQPLGRGWVLVFVHICCQSMRWIDV
jgi:hypothetical protein